MSLKTAVDVLLMYWTAAQEEDGFRFYTDVYQRDQELILSFNTPVAETLMKAMFE